MLQPGEVQVALDRMKAGDGSPEVFEVIVSAAEAFAALVPEYVFRAPFPRAAFAVQNDMMAETMQRARPTEKMLLRLAPPLPDWDENGDSEAHS
jgi:hypothetical protein